MTHSEDTFTLPSTTTEQGDACTLHAAYQLDSTGTYETPTENPTLQKVYDKVADVETKVDLIVDYLELKWQITLL